MVYQRISDYITSKGIKQAHLCRETGLSANAVSLILKGQQRLTVEDFLAICDALNEKPSRFLS